MNAYKGKVVNGFYLSDSTDYVKSEGVQSLKNEHVYVYLYDKEKKRHVGQWRDRSEFVRC